MPHTVTISIAYSFAKDLFHHVEVTSYEDNFMFIYYSYISIRFVRFPSMSFYRSLYPLHQTTQQFRTRVVTCNFVAISCIASGAN